MLHFRAPDATLLLVIDEVSQDIHQDSQRMLKLQSFVSSLGTRVGTLRLPDRLLARRAAVAEALDLNPALGISKLRARMFVTPGHHGTPAPCQAARLPSHRRRPRPDAPTDSTKDRRAGSAT